MPKETVSGDEFVAYTLNLPRLHLEEIRAEAIERSSPQKQVRPAEVARSIIANWYENKIKSSHA